MTIQYLPVCSGLHGAEILSRHRFQIFFFKNSFLKETYLKVTFHNRYIVLKYTLF